jgi:hypothetical protein
MWYIFNLPLPTKRLTIAKIVAVTHLPLCRITARPSTIRYNSGTAVLNAHTNSHIVSFTILRTRMGICGSKSLPEDRAAAEKSRRIEKDNEEDFEKELEKIKLLLLGK